MAAKFMRVKQIVIPFITLLILVSQIAGCAVMSQNEALEEMQKGNDVVIEYAEPDYNNQSTIIDDKFIIEDAPVSNNTEVEENEGQSTIIETDDILSQEKMQEYFQRAYEYVWNDPNNYNADYKASDMDLEALGFFLEADGYGMTDEHKAQYLEWKYTTYATNAYKLNFSGSYLNTVGVDKMYVYATPHTTLPPIGEFYKFDVIDNAMSSDDGTWMCAEYQGVTIYYRAADLGELTHAEWEQAQEQHKIEASFKDVDETVYAKDTVNIRTEPNTSSDILGKLYKGNSITRIGIGTGDYEGWSKVVTNEGETMFISSRYLTREKIEDNRPTNSGGAGGNGNGNGNSVVESPEPEYPPTSGNTNGSLPDWIKDDPANQESTAGESTDNNIEGGSQGEGSGQGFWIN